LLPVIQLVSIDQPDGQREETNNSGRNSSDDGRGGIEEPTDIPHHDNRHMVSGAVFVIAILIEFTIFCIRRNPS